MPIFCFKWRITGVTSTLLSMDDIPRETAELRTLVAQTKRRPAAYFTPGDLHGRQVAIQYSKSDWNRHLPRPSRVDKGEPGQSVSNPSTSSKSRTLLGKARATFKACLDLLRTPKR